MGYFTPRHGHSINFAVNQKLDSIIAELVEQKQFRIDAKKETVKLAEGFVRLEAELSELKNKVNATDVGSGSKQKKKIPLELSVCFFPILFSCGLAITFI